MSMNSLEKTEDKISFIVGMFKHFQPTLTLPEQIALLTLWEESFVSEEEYELAGVVIEEIEKIKNNPNLVPQKGLIIIQTQEVKKSIYERFWFWVKGIFKKKN